MNGSSGLDGLFLGLKLLAVGILLIAIITAARK